MVASQLTKGHPQQQFVCIDDDTFDDIPTDFISFDTRKAREIGQNPEVRKTTAQRFILSERATYSHWIETYV